MLENWTSLTGCMHGNSSRNKAMGFTKWIYNMARNYAAFHSLHQSTVINTPWFTLKVTIKCDVRSSISAQKFQTLSGSPAMTHNYWWHWSSIYLRPIFLRDERELLVPFLAIRKVHELKILWDRVCCVVWTFPCKQYFRFPCRASFILPQHTHFYWWWQWLERYLHVPAVESRGTTV